MDIPNPGIELKSPALQVASLPAELPRKTKNEKYGENEKKKNVKQIFHSFPIECWGNLLHFVRQFPQILLDQRD